MRLKFTLFLLLILVCSCAKGQFILRGPIVGAVTDTSARVTIQTSSSLSLAIEVSTTSDFSSNVVRTSTATTSAANSFFSTIQLSGLFVSTKYFLRPVINGSPSSFSEPRSFKTFPRALHDSSFVFTFGSCQRQNNSVHRSNVFPTMQKADPLLFFQLGDWAYPDMNISPNFAASDSLIAQAYQLKYDPSYALDTLAATTPIDYVYDDHDYGANNADGTFPHKANSISAYERMFPHYDLPNDSSGLWHTFYIGNVQFFVLDLRSERSPSNDAVQYSNGMYSFNPPPGHSILRGTQTAGPDQKSWLLNALATSKARWKVIMSSVDWNPAARQEIPLLALYATIKKDPSKLYDAVDEWVGYPEDQDSIIALAQREHIKNVIVCSADVHTAMMDDGTNSVFPEIVSGNLEVPNSRLYHQLDSLGLGGLWDRGGQLDDTLDTYGRITVLTSPKAALRCEIVNERDSVISSMTLADSNLEGVAFATDPYPGFGTKIVDQNEISIFAIASLNAQSSGKIYLADEAGRTVRVLADGNLHGGEWRFRLLTNTLSSGTYFFVLEAAGGKWTSKFRVTK